MKPHHKLTAQAVFDMLKSPTTELPDRVCVGAPTQERAEAAVRLIELAQTPDAIRILCIACGNDVPMLSASACECGGFVCPHCVELEGTDRCDHERPTFLEEE